jgi:hypothetical protein
VISVTSEGDFKNTDAFLKKMVKGDIYSCLHGYGQVGVAALARNTPKDTGLTASAWSYEVLVDKKSSSIIWSNHNVVNGRPVAILLQYGHATGNGGYVQGRDYINPALQPIFDRIAAEVWKEVTKA